MVPTDEAIITRQMLYSAFRVPNTCAAFAIFPPAIRRKLLRLPHLTAQNDSSLRFVVCIVT